MMKRMTPRTIIGALAILMLAATIANADPFPSPKVDFEADLTMTLNQDANSQPYVINGKIHASNGNELREISHMGRTTAILKQSGREETYTLIHSQKSYMVNKGKDRRDPERMIRDGELTITKQGKEKKNGHNTTKYKITSTDSSRDAFEGYAWFTKENIPVLIIGTASDGNRSNKIHIAYDNILKKKQPAKLFKIPTGYRALNTGMPTGAPAGYGAPGGKMPAGLTPEQMEQLKKIMQQKKGG